MYWYDDNLRARLAIFQLSEKDVLWWHEAKSVYNKHNKELNWKTFQKLFKDKYMLE